MHAHLPHFVSEELRGVDTADLQAIQQTLARAFCRLVRSAAAAAAAAVVVVVVAAAVAAAAAAAAAAAVEQQNG